MEREATELLKRTRTSLLCLSSRSKLISREAFPAHLLQLLDSAWDRYPVHGWIIRILHDAGVANGAVVRLTHRQVLQILFETHAQMTQGLFFQGISATIVSTISSLDFLRWHTYNRARSTSLFLACCS